MYRLVVYELAFLLVAAGILGFFGVLSYSPIFLAFSVVVIFGLCWISNRIFAFFFDAPYNPESTWITALILALIITPPHAWLDPQYLPLVFWASTLAMASKYILAIGKKNIFNPAALGVALTSLVLGLSASWWVGTLAMLPFVLLGGLLIVRKIHRFDLWWAFIGTFTAGIIFFSLQHGLNLAGSLSQSLLYAPAFFFATVMLTEPMTTPPNRMWRILYGMGTAIVFLPNVGIGSFYFTPELALLFANLCSYIVSPKQKLVLKLKEKIRLSKDTFEFVFTPDRPISFKPGQYMEWTLAHAKADSRSVRRYFTVASSPTEPDLRLGVKFYNPASSFKKTLFSMRPNQAIVASQLAGGFTLPRNKDKKMVFIAGGIGVTPFRSMVQYLIDKKEARSATLFYSNKTAAEIAYKNVFDRAAREIGLKTIYVLTDEPNQVPGMYSGQINGALIAREVPDFRERVFYISGPHGMVNAFKKTLRDMSVPRRRIKIDYFPGFA